MSSEEEGAPSYSLDVPSYLSIQYPLKVQNIDKAISIVGGSEKISRCFIEPDSKLELKLRPGDPYSHPISSIQSNTENVLLKISIPKRILQKYNGDIQKSLDDCDLNNIKYKVNVHGILKNNYLFRQLADFQILPHRSDFINKFQSSVGSQNLDNIKQFTNYIEDDYKIEPVTYDNKNMDIPPLLRYARVDVPYNYQYFGNVLVDENGIKAKSTVKLHTIFLEWGEEPPTTYPLVLQKELDKAEADVEILKKNGMERLIRESPAGYFLQCLELVKRLFEMKPIWIRRHINWMLPPVIRPQLRFVLPYVSYSMKKGPWRQSYIKFGYDPTKDPNAWAYQVEGFRSCVKSVKDIEIYKMFENDQESGMIVPNSLKKYADQLKDPSPEIKQFEFLKIPKQLFYDGVNPTSAVSFQFIDMTDDDVNTILSHRQQSQVCYEKTGWIDWITLCRLRSVIKYKLNCIKNGKTMDQNRISHLMNARTFKSIDSKQLIPPEDDEDIGDDNDDTNIAGGDDGDGGLDEGSDGDEVQSDTNMANSGDFDLSNNGLDVSKDDLIARLKTFNPGSIRLLDELDGLLKQESIMKLEE